MKLSKKTGALLAALSVCAALPQGLTTQSFAAKAVSGDFNGDGKLGMSDIQAVLKAYVYETKVDSRILNACDADGNGKLDLTDCTLLLRQYVNGGSGSASGGSGLVAGKDYAKGTALRIAAGYNNAYTGITFDAKTAGNGVTLVDGKTYKAGDLKPTWVELQNRLGIRFEDKYKGTSASREFQWWQEQLDQVDIVMATTNQFNEHGARGKIVDLSKYLDKMPNFKTFLDANPIVRMSITGYNDKGKLGAIYFTPYFDGVNDVERMPLMRTDWVEKLLNGSGDFTAEKCGTTAVPVYTPYMPKSGKVAVDVVKADGSGVQQLTKNYDNAGNIIDKMNKAGAMSGEEAVNMLRDYIDAAYNGYYGDNRADLFIGQNAAWDADELVALLRCVTANAQTLNGTDTVEGLFCREGNNNRRRTDMYRFAGTLFGARGLNSTNEYLYVGSDNKLHDARMEEQTYAALDKMNEMTKEGLIGSNFINETAEKSADIIKSDLGFMSYDYSQNQTLFNEQKDPDTGKALMDDDEEYRAVMIPVARWYDGSAANGKYMRFTDSWRSAKDQGWGISAAGVAGSNDKLNAALKLIDYAYSKEGQILMSYGPDAFIKNGETFTFNGEEWPVIADAAYAEIRQKWEGNYTNYARHHLGSALIIKSQPFEYQCTTAAGKTGAGYISKAIALGTIKHTTLSLESNPWYSTVPTVLLQNAMENDILNRCPELVGSSSKFSTEMRKSNLLVDIIAKGYSGSGTSNRAETINTVKKTWKGDTVLETRNTAWDRLLKS